MQVRSTIVIYLFILLAALAVYFQVSNHQFVNFDDNIYITENYRVRDGLTIDNILWAFKFSDKNKTYWHPLTWISHMLDCELFGLNPKWHHWTNLFFHIFNSLLLFYVLFGMTGMRWQSAAVSILFAVHPINVETVAWVSERKNLLSTIFWILTIIAYFQYTKRPNFIRYLGIIVMFCIGLLSKPMLVTLPFVLLLLDYWPLDRIRKLSVNEAIKDIGRLFAEKLPLIIISLVSIGLSYVSLHNYGQIASTQSISLDVRIANALVSYIRYLIKIFYPVDLAVYYPFPDSIQTWQWVGASLLLICFTLFVVHHALRLPALFTGWFWFIGTLVPVSGLIQGGLWPALADRWAYIPAMGVYFMIFMSFPKNIIDKKWMSGAISGLFFIILIIMMSISWLQTRHWADSIALHSHSLMVTEENPEVYFNLANAYRSIGNIEKAIKYYSLALKASPTFVKARTNLGILFIDQNNIRKAIEQFRMAADLSPKTPRVQNNLGMALFLGGFNEEAIKHIELALKLNPNYKQAQKNLNTIINRNKENGGPTR